MMHRLSKSNISNNLKENMKELKMALVQVLSKKMLMATKCKA